MQTYIRFFVDKRIYVRYNSFMKTYVRFIKCFSRYNLCREKGEDFMYKRKSYLRKIKRQQEVRRNIFFTITILFTIIVLSITLTTSVSSAQTINQEVYYKYYANIKIESGNTLIGIANEYMDFHYSGVNEYVKEVKYINRLCDSKIVSGEYLVVPYYSTEYICD